VVEELSDGPQPGVGDARLFETYDGFLFREVFECTLDLLV
jgi:hypothetical protein